LQNENENQKNIAISRTDLQIKLIFILRYSALILFTLQANIYLTDYLQFSDRVDTKISSSRYQGFRLLNLCRDGILPVPNTFPANEATEPKTLSIIMSDIDVEQYYDIMIHVILG